MLATARSPAGTEITVLNFILFSRRVLLGVLKKLMWGLLLATPLSMHYSGVAHADFASYPSFDPNCAQVGQAGRPPSLDRKFFNGLRVRASGDGTTGVFFLERGQQTYVLKFEDELALGVTASHRFLAAMLVPHDTTLAEFMQPDIIRALYDEVNTAAVTSMATLTADQQDRLKGRLDRLNKMFASSGTAPKKVIITQFLKAKEGMSSLGAGLELPREINRLSPEDLVTVVKQFRASVKALGNPHNQGLLGYLYVVDSFLGNEDRLVKPSANLANVFVAQGENDTACLVAIDNDAFAPTSSYVASMLGIPKNNPRPKITTDNSKNPPVDIEEPELSSKSGKFSLSSSDYLDAVLNNFKDQYSGRLFTGPDAAVTGMYNDKKKKKPPVSFPPVCDAIADDQLLHRIGRFIRQQIVTTLNSDMNILDNAEEVVFNAAADNFDVGEVRILPDKNGKIAGLENVCSTRINIGYVDGDNENGTMISESINWKDFDANFALGAQLAMADIAKIDVVSKQAGAENMRDTIAAMLADLPIGKYSPVSPSPFIARALYYKYLLGGIAPVDIKTVLLQNHKKEAFTTSISVSGLKYLGYTEKGWVLSAP